MVALIVCVAACGSKKQLSKNELISVDRAVDKKFQKISQIFEADGIRKAAEYSRDVEIIETSVGNFLISCSIVANFYDPKVKSEFDGKNLILPVSSYGQAYGHIFLLDEGYKFRNVTISVFARLESRYAEPTITKCKNYV